MVSDNCSSVWGEKLYPYLTPYAKQFIPGKVKFYTEKIINLFTKQRRISLLPLNRVRFLKELFKHKKKRLKIEKWRQTRCEKTNHQVWEDYFYLYIIYKWSVFWICKGIPTNQ